MRNSKQYTIMTEIICLIFLLLFIFPLGLMLVKSFQNGGVNNYKMVFNFFNLWKNLRTSLIVVGGTLAIVAVASSMAAFAFSKLQFPGKNVIYYILLTGLMVPTASLIFPLYQVIRGIHVNNTPFALIFPYATLSCCFNLMVLKNYYDSLPNELIDAAKIDGASIWQTFYLVMMPIARPGLTVVLIQTFLTSWNELQMAMIFINNTDEQPLSVVPLRFMQRTATAFTTNVMYAALVICLLPIAIFYIFASKNLVSGATSGAVKG